MMQFSFNIGYEFDKSNTVLNTFPLCYTYESVRDFILFIRRSAPELATWATANNVPKSSLILFLIIDDGNFYWDFKIALKNVREYKPMIKLSDEDLNLLVEQRDRDFKIDNIFK